MHQFICLKWGDKYPALYVNRLYRMISKYMQAPFVLYCLTENPAGLDPDIQILALKNQQLKGWWYKLSLFESDFYGLEGDLLFLDLDVVITGNLDDFFSYKPGEFLIANDLGTEGYNSSVFRFCVGSCPYLWDDFVVDTAGVMGRYYGDQDWISERGKDIHLWPSEWVVSFKKQCDARAKRSFGLLGRYLRKNGFYSVKGEAKVPDGARIIQFHGKPDPEDVVDGPYDLFRQAPWIRYYWGDSE